MAKSISAELYEALQDLDSALGYVIHSCLWDESSPGCDCGCGGDTADYARAHADEAEFLDKLPALLQRVQETYAKQDPAEGAPR